VSLRAAIFASGRGSNFQVLADRAAGDPDYPWSPVLLVVDRPGVGALELAEERGIPTAMIPPGDDAESFGEALLAPLAEARVDMILLAGYLRLMPIAVVRHFRGRMLNLHPALLPAFGGKGMYGARVHQAVIASGARVSGVTVHFVDEEYDRGRILAQWPVPVLPSDTPESLQQRIRAAEHVLYPAAAAELARAILRGEDPGALPVAGEHFHLSDHPPEFP